MKKILLGIALSALSILAVRAQYNPCVASSTTNCSPAPSVTLAPVSPIALCLCGPVSASTTNIINSGLVVVVSIAESCAVMTNTIATNYPTIISNWTVVYWNSQRTTNAGLSAWFLPTNTGSGSITFYVKYTTPNPCIGTYITNKSASVSVTNCAPLIASQPASQTVPVGKGVSFSVVACGSAALGYQWSFDGANIPGATASSYTKNSVQLTDSGNYVVTVTDVLGSVTSSTAVLTVVDDDLGPDSNGNGVPDWLETAMGYDPRQPNGLGTTQPGYSLFLAQPQNSSQLP